jgi:hypothetical protein
MRKSHHPRLSPDSTHATPLSFVKGLFSGGISAGSAIRSHSTDEGKLL